MALVDGVSYSLSTQLYHQKSVLFVKLTDSALRAIEDYLRTQHKTGNHATIQFLGNEGRIRIPTSQQNDGNRFDFSLSSSADIEGPQGSFECIRQSGSRSLESMGAMRYKMRIKANDDVYAETRQRIKAVEEERKQDCAKEIKHSGGDLKRKIKAKMRANQPSPASMKMNPYGNASDLSASMSKMSVKSSSSSSPNCPSSNSYSQNNRLSNGPNSQTNSGSSNRNYSPVPKPLANASNPVISKRPLRERLIHLLAVKTYKKPELMNRLYRDGIKDKDKKSLMQVLREVSSYKNNEYNLLRGIWNDVQEDWPFYSPQEIEFLKRRKPQNLTPPGSDSSIGSCSSLSPRSTNSLSPSSTNSYGRSGKRAPSDEVILAQSSKKQRVSHFKRPNSAHNLSLNPSSQLSSPADEHLGYASSSPGGGASEEGFGHHYPWLNGEGPYLSTKPTSLDSDETDSIDSGNGSSSSSSSSSSVGYYANSRDRDGSQNFFGAKVASSEGFSSSQGNGCNRVSSTTNGSSSQYQFNQTPQCSPDSQEETRLDRRDKPFSTNEPAVIHEAGEGASDVHSSRSPPYMSKYGRIESPEQRYQYKEDFNAEYLEYRRLHSVIDEVSKKFAHLQRRLQQEERGSIEYLQIKNEIVEEYYSNKNNKQYQEAKEKFEYLHEKLSFIKQLVMDYDSEHSYIDDGYAEAVACF